MNKQLLVYVYIYICIYIYIYVYAYVQDTKWLFQFQFNSTYKNMHVRDFPKCRFQHGESDIVSEHPLFILFTSCSLGLELASIDGKCLVYGASGREMSCACPKTCSRGRFYFTRKLWASVINI